MAKKPIFDCFDCQQNTAEIDEYFMIHNELWDIVTAPPKKGGYRILLCIGCTEDRLGRKLTKDDFTDCPLNTGELDFNPHSDRMKDRLSA